MVKEVKYMGSKKENYTFVIRDSKNKNWRVSLEWLKQNLGIPDRTFYNKMFETNLKSTFNKKVIAFLRELHEPQTVAYFKHKILEQIKDRTKQFYASTIFSKIETYSLWEEKRKAWDLLIEEKKIIEGKRGWYHTRGLFE